MSVNQAQTMKTLLEDLEKELKLMGVWEAQAPSEAALNSHQPFAIDYLSFNQWLQWLFLPKCMHC